MYCKAFCTTLHGVDASIVQVEADMNEGLPLFSMVGVLAPEVKESKARVRIS